MLINMQISVIDEIKDNFFKNRLKSLEITINNI